MKKQIEWDRDLTHGGHPDAKYIRHKENLDSLSIMAPHLVKAFAKRKERHKEVMGMMETIINLATQVIYLLKARQARKDGVPRN